MPACPSCAAPIVVDAPFFPACRARLTTGPAGDAATPENPARAGVALLAPPLPDPPPLDPLPPLDQPPPLDPLPPLDRPMPLDRHPRALDPAPESAVPPAADRRVAAWLDGALLTAAATPWILRRAAAALARTLAEFAGRPRRIRLVGIAAVSLVVLVAGLVVARSALADRISGPAPTALAFLEDLARGDARGALAQTTDVPADPSVVVNEAAVRNQLRSGTISGVHIGTTTVQQDSATVAVRYRLAGRVVHTRLSLVRGRRHPRFGMFPVWRVSNPTSRVHISAPIAFSEVIVDGQRVSLTDGLATATVLPGRVPVWARGPAPYVIARPVVVDVPAAGDQSQARLTMALAPGGPQAVRAAISQRFAACESALPVPAGCPFGFLPLGDTQTRVRWTEPADPGASAQIALDPSTGAITVSGTYRLRVSYQYRNSLGAGVDAEQVTGSYAGAVSLDRPTAQADLSPGF